MNCLQFAIKYKLQHVNASIHVENYFYKQLKEAGGFNREFIRYLGYVGFNNYILMILIPHFYILHDKHRYEGDSKSNIEYLKDIIRNPFHLRETETETDLDEFMSFIDDAY